MGLEILSQTLKVPIVTAAGDAFSPGPLGTSNRVRFLHVLFSSSAGAGHSHLWPESESGVAPVTSHPSDLPQGCTPCGPCLDDFLQFISSEPSVNRGELTVGARNSTPQPGKRCWNTPPHRCSRGRHSSCIV